MTASLLAPAGSAAAAPRADLAALPRIALVVRERVVRLATGGGCFLGASLSVADLLVHLYGRVLRISPETLDDPGRDYLFLSKGHDVPALYATLAELGFLDPARLAGHLVPGSAVYWHPNRAVPGVEFHSGSLGHLLVHLYGRVLRISPETLDDPGRDYLFLSKGHDVPALYATLAELGFLDPARLAGHLVPGSAVYWHPNRAVPGVEFHSGSLGHLLSVALGVAYDIRLSGGDNRVFVILGDGELDEGSVWEACLVAAALKLDNLTAIIDRNGFQANLPTEELVPLEPLPAKLEAFGWSSRSVDGHSFDDLEAVCSELPFAARRPSAIVARTVRGKGLASLEGRADRWFADLTAAEVEALVAELHGARPAELATPGRLAR